MDIYGIGSGIESGAMIFFQSCRQTGRTTRMIEALKPGDRVVVHEAALKRHMEKELARAGKAGIEVVAVPVNESHSLVVGRPRAEGRTYFTHDWLQLYWLRAIREIQQDLAQLSASASRSCGGGDSSATRPQPFSFSKTL